MAKTKNKQRIVIGAIIVVVVVAVIVALTLTSSKSPSTTTQPKKVTTTTQRIPLSTTALNASTSVVRAASFLSKNPQAPTTAADITAASAQDRPTLVILKNLGQMASAPNAVAFKWKFGTDATNIVCVMVPRVRKDLPTNLATLKVACPAGLK